MSNATLNTAFPHGIDLTAPDGIERLLAFHRDRYGVARMDAGDDADDDGGDDADNDDTDQDAQGDQDDDADADDADGDDKDWKAEFEKQQRINRKLERRTKRDMDRIRQLEKGTGTKPAPKPTPKSGNDDDQQDQPDPEELRKAARAEVEAEMLKDRVRDKIEVKAAKQFADSADAVALVLAEHDIDDFLTDGKIDVDSIQDALSDLLEKKPYLGEAAAQGGEKKRFQGKADGGSKPQKPARPKSLNEAVSRALSPK